MINRTRFLDSILADSKYSQSRNRYVSLDVEGSEGSDQFEFMVGILAPSPKESPERNVSTRKLKATDGLREYAPEHVLLCGPPGSGKTATLRRLLLEMAALARTDSSAPIPVLVELKYDESITNLIAIFVAEHGGPIRTDYVETMLSSGQLFLILDGLNELPSESRHSELDLFRSKYRRTTSMVFSKRDLGPGGDLRVEKKLQLLPLTDKQIRLYVKRHVHDKRERLLRLLTGRIRDLAVTPLFLSMLCAVYNTRNDIPANLAEVFRAFMEEFYCRTFKQDAPVSDEIKSLWNRLLARLAFDMIRGQSRTEIQLAIPRKDAEVSIANCLTSQLAAGNHPNSSLILESLLNHHLVRLGIGGTIEFQHQMIQEYFAAEFLLQELVRISDSTLKQDYLNYLKWTEPLLMALQLIADSKQVQRIIGLAVDVDLALAAKLAGAAKQIFQGQAIGLIENLCLPQRTKILLLGKTSSEKVLPVLIDALSDKDPQTRITAAQCLAEINNSETMGPLINCLNDTHSSLPETAAFALGKTGSDDAVEPLFNLLHSEDTRFRSAAGMALGTIGSEMAVNRLIEALGEKDHRVRWAAVEGLAVVRSERAVNALMEALLDEDESVCWIAEWWLVKIGTRDVANRFMQALKHESPNVRRCAARGLGEMAVSWATDDLIAHFLTDKDLRVRWDSGVALGKIGRADGMTCLSEALRGESAETRWAAAFALAHAADSKGLPVIVDAIGNQDSDRRIKATLALSQLDSEEVQPILIDQLRSDENSTVRWIAASALERIGGKETVGALISALEDEDRNVRAHAAEALGKIGDEKAVGPLLKLLGERVWDWVPQLSAAEALGKIGQPNAIAPLIRILESGKEAYAFPWWAATALEKFGDYRAISSLWKLTIDQGERILLDTIAGIQQRCRFYKHDLLPVEGGFYILHLSDLHFGTVENAREWYGQLFLDLTRELKLLALDCLVLSGDIGNLSNPEEYDAAEIFLSELIEDFRLGPDNIVIVPGNHDLNWQISEDAFGSGTSELPEPTTYEKRFMFFSNLLKKITGREFPSKKEDQWILTEFPNHKILIIGLNSCCEVDHLHAARASINGVACVSALRHIESTHDSYIKVAVWHHPLDSPDEDRIKDTGFMELLSKSGFKLALHGHVHRGENRSFRPDSSPEASRINIIAAGTFGAATKELVPAYPWQYQCHQN